jgi:hypothetical protein
MKGKKPLTRRQEIRALRQNIAELKDSHRVLLWKDVVPLMKRLPVLKRAEKLARAERALVRSVEEDKGSPQLELLSFDMASPPAAPPPAGDGRLEAQAPLLTQAERLGQ